MGDQDWSTVTLTKNKYNSGKSNKKKKGNQSNDDYKTRPKRTRVDEEQEDFRTAKIGQNFSVALQRARLKKGWKQQQLAQQLNVRQTVINQYESGKAKPNSQLIARMNRILGVKLPSVQKVGQKKKRKKKKPSNY